MIEKKYICNFKPTSETSAKFKYIGYTDKNVSDAVNDITTSENICATFGNNTLFINDYNSTSFIAKYCTCNVEVSYLTENEIIPIYYLSVFYNRKMMSGCLFNIFLKFQPSEKIEKKHIEMGEPISGNYYFELISVHENILNKIQSKINSEEYTNCEMLFKKIAIDFFPTANKTYEKMIDIYMNSYFTNLLKYTIDIVDRERLLTQFGGNYELPTRVTKMEDLANNPEKINDFLK